MTQYLEEEERKRIYRLAYSTLVEVRILKARNSSNANPFTNIEQYRDLGDTLKSLGFQHQNLHNLAWVGPASRMDDHSVVWVDIGANQSYSSWWFHPSRKDDALLFKLKVDTRG